MAVTFFEPGRARKDIIKEVVLAWYEVDPVTARQIADDLTELRKAQINKSGKWKGGDGFIKGRFPADLVLSMKKFLPDFGTDEDLLYASEEFPRLFPVNMSRTK
jgi:hypothetical protein